jgi:hypothetical protein
MRSRVTFQDRGVFRRVKSIFGTSGLAILCFALFAYGVYEFRFAKRDQTAAGLAVRATEVNVAISPVVRSGADGQDRDADLMDVSGGSAFGFATRGKKDGRFFHALKTSLPAIDREVFFYEGWLVRPAPFDFFSTGEMATNSLGEFVLEFTGESGAEEGNYAGYTKVVVTLEARDGNPAPAQHILEGEFTDDISR